MTAIRLWFLIISALVLQQVLPAIGVGDKGAATTVAATREALGTPRDASPAMR